MFDGSRTAGFMALFTVGTLGITHGIYKMAIVRRRLLPCACPAALTPTLPFLVPYISRRPLLTRLLSKRLFCSPGTTTGQEELRWTLSTGRAGRRHRQYLCAGRRNGPGVVLYRTAMRTKERDGTDTGWRRSSLNGTLLHD